MDVAVCSVGALACRVGWRLILVVPCLWWVVLERGAHRSPVGCSCHHPQPVLGVRGMLCGAQGVLGAPQQHTECLQGPGMGRVRLCNPWGWFPTCAVGLGASRGRRQRAEGAGAGGAGGLGPCVLGCGFRASSSEALLKCTASRASLLLWGSSTTLACIPQRAVVGARAQ